VHGSVRLDLLDVDDEDERGVPLLDLQQWALAYLLGIDDGEAAFEDDVRHVDER
jgi:hypothetical protein